MFEWSESGNQTIRLLSENIEKLRSSKPRPYTTGIGEGLLKIPYLVEHYSETTRSESTFALRLKVLAMAVSLREYLLAVYADLHLPRQNISVVCDTTILCRENVELKRNLCQMTPWLNCI